MLKKYYVFPKENFSYISRNGTLYFPAKKTPKKSPPEIFLVFLEMELSSSNIKKIGHIFSKESVSHISDKRTLHFSAQAIKIKELYPRKSYFTLGNENPPKMSCSF